MNCVDLCTGIGWLSKGLSLVLPLRHLCFVEKDPYCARVLERRFPDTPIWDDITTFNPDPWAGMVHLIATGVPCFTRDSYVLTRTHGYRPIQDISTGDLVLTHRGRWRRVTAKLCTLNAPVLEIKWGGSPGVRVTPEHPFLKTKQWEILSAHRLRLVLGLS